MAKSNPPAEFDFMLEKWAEWAMRWSRYRQISKLDKEEEDIQINSFLCCVGPTSESIFSSLGLSEENKKKYSEVLAGFENYFSPKKYVIYERAKFLKRDQQQAESVEHYIRALNELADKCDFGDKRSEQIRDRLVVGIADQGLSREMQKMDIGQLTEATAVPMARQAEQVDKKVKELYNDVKSLDAVRVSSSKHKHSTQQSKAANSAQADANPCGRCGHNTHRFGKCPAQDSMCHKCQKRGHFARVCRSKGGAVQSVEENDYDQPTSNVEPCKKRQHFLGEITDRDANVEWTKSVVVDPLLVPVRFKLDTGADVTIIPQQLCKPVQLKEPDKSLFGLSNS